jgi:hypothetical protein
VTQSDARTITSTTVSRKQSRADMKKYWRDLDALQGVTLRMNRDSPEVSPPPPPPLPPPLIVWEQRPWQLALEIKGEYLHMSEAERIAKYGRAGNRKESSLARAYEWAAKHYEIPGHKISGKLLADSLYQHDPKL